MTALLPILAIAFFLVVHWRRFSITRPDLLTAVFVRDYIVFAAGGYLYFSNSEHFSDHYILTKLPDGNGLEYASYSAFYFICVFIVFFNIFKFLGNIINKPSKESLTPIKEFVFFLSIFSYIILGLLIYSMLSYDIGLASLFAQENTRELAEARALATHGSGYLSFAKFLTSTWAPMISFTWIYIWLNERKNLSKFYMFTLFISVFGGFIATFWTLEKAKLAYFMFGLVGIWLYSGRKIKPIYWFLLIFLAISTILIGYLMTYGEKAYDDQYLTQIFVHRFVTQSVGSIVSFTLYPNILDFKGLSGISNFLASLVGQTFSSPYSDMIKYMEPETADISGSLSSFATGEAYALFGIIGVIISPIIAAMYFGILESTRRYRNSRIVWSPLYAQFFGVPYLSSSFYSFFWPIGFAYSIAPFFLIWFLARLIQERAR